MDWTALLIACHDHRKGAIIVTFVGNTFQSVTYAEKFPFNYVRVSGLFSDEITQFIVRKARELAESKLKIDGNKYLTSHFSISVKTGEWRHAGNHFNYTGKLEL